MKWRTMKTASLALSSRLHPCLDAGRAPLAPHAARLNSLKSIASEAIIFNAAAARRFRREWVSAHRAAFYYHFGKQVRAPGRCRRLLYECTETRRGGSALSRRKFRQRQETFRELAVRRWIVFAGSSNHLIDLHLHARGRLLPPG